MVTYSEKKKTGYTFVIAGMVLLLVWALMGGHALAAGKTYEAYKASLPKGCEPVPRECFEQAVAAKTFGMYDWADRPPEEGGIDDWRSRQLKEPGTTFKYNDVRVNVLSYALLQVWREPLPEVLKEEIMDPIGATSTWRWFGYENSWVNVDGMKIQSVSGGGHSGGGIFINTEDHARFGLLFLNHGNWSGEQLISKDWVLRLQEPSTANESYGYMWWLNKGPGKWEGVPETVFYAAGFGGNYIVVDQEHDLVIVTRWLEPAKIGEFVRMVMGALN